MFRNYVKTAFRNLRKNKIFSFLNMAGLAIGIACAALIFLWVEDEVTYNHNFNKRDQLYRVMANAVNNGQVSTSAGTPGLLAQAMKTEIPGVKNATRLSWRMNQLAVLGDKSINEPGMYADPSVLSMFSLDFLYGNPVSSLGDPQSVVISETMSKKFFGNDDPVGKIIKMNAHESFSVDGSFTVAGVFKDMPVNSTYNWCHWISPYEGFESKNPWMKPWNNSLVETLVELETSADPVAINKKLTGFLATKTGATAPQCFLFSMNDWNLRNHFTNGKIDGGNIKYVKLFSLIAAIILLIACINFMNLSTARSEHRAREVGVRKVMGAGKRKLITQFIAESLLLSFLSVILAVAFIYLALPAYDSLVNKDLSLQLFSLKHLSYLFGIAVITGLLAGSYPAFYLSSFSPIKVLNGIKTKTAWGVIFIRKGLVVSQFAVSIALIICTAVIYQQIQHVKQRDLGINKNKVIDVSLQSDLRDHFSVVKSQLLSTGYVENAALSLHDPLHMYSSMDKFTWAGKDPNNKIFIHLNAVSPEYISTMQMKLTSGRDFYSDKGLNKNEVIINESLARIMGKEGHASGTLSIDTMNFHIAGIIKDYVYNDMYASNMPSLLYSNPQSATVMTIRFKAGADISKALAKTEAVFKANNPGFAFQYQFLDDEFDGLFVTETLISRLAGLFSILAIFISCLGLFGLAAYTAERRTREIGIRKVLGASVKGLAQLLSKDFLQLVGLSCLLAFPVAWWAMHSWLQDYEYRTVIHWWVFVIAAILALLIALVTVSFQSIKAALTNPVKSLRAE